MSNHFFTFTGNESLIVQPLIRNIQNSFTYEFWIRPTLEQHMDIESSHGTYGTYGKKYIVGPSFSQNRNEVGIGISVGTNGISVYEHTVDHLPAVLVHPILITDWIHIALVYQDKVPFLYINGQFVKEGLPSIKSNVFSSGVFGGYSPYGFFTGDVKEIRIWDHSRTPEQIKSMMHTALTGEEPGLYWYVNKSSNTLVHERVKRDVEISVVMPSFNKYPSNLFTLYSLENQTFDLSKVEVILVDDASTDVTPSIISNNNFPFLFKYIRCERNAGRARTRNMGIKAAVGNIIVFLDAEVIVEPQFIENHYMSHKGQDFLVVSGTVQQKGIYSTIVPGLSTPQLEQLYSLMKNRSQNFDDKWNDFNTNNRPVQLLTKKDIQTQRFKAFSFVKSHEVYFQNEVLNHYGDDLAGFSLPWLFFLTGNVSLKKNLLEQAGLFEEYEGYGWEDAEMGYRLYKQGAKFVNKRNLDTYHQEHPISPNNTEEANINAYKFQKKHGDIDVLVLALTLLPKPKSVYEINQILIEYKTLCGEHPHTFLLFKNAFASLLEQVSFLVANKLKVTHLLKLIASKYSQYQINQAINEKIVINKMGKYQKLIHAFDTLMTL
jgi:glycosyltransferase involved in cell wall biosynthesis